MEKEQWMRCADFSNIKHKYRCLGIKQFSSNKYMKQIFNEVKILECIGFINETFDMQYQVTKKS